MDQRIQRHTTRLGKYVSGTAHVYEVKTMAGISMVTFIRSGRHDAIRACRVITIGSFEIGEGFGVRGGIRLDGITTYGVAKSEGIRRRS
jgi:hypothetical protein